ncbi:hypothetical protein QAD02_022324 [Eretmocerus hayati]|uniref:Uncharacterized protein n=1 Tax=Eretmocerus hayati TaxID=131215 RepID=A0ACC2PSF0_9HYME|nr:hypothetical protein QAD02_022324 [Eretmocerus hayati]
MTIPAHEQLCRTNGEEEPSPSLSRSGEDNLSNSDGPLLSNSKKQRDKHQPLSARVQMHTSAMLLHRDNWQKNCASSKDYTSSNDEKQKNQFLWMLTLILSFIGFCNLILNLTILVVLRVGQGMESLEIIPEQDLIKFYGSTDLDKVCLHKGICEGFGDEPVELMGDAAGVNIRVANHLHGMTFSNFQVLENGTSVSQVESFEIKDPRSGSPIFSTDFPNFSLPQGVKKIEVNSTQTHRVVAPKTDDLIIKSGESISMQGAEGLSLDSKDILWTAKADITLRSRKDDIIIDANDSINFPKVPIAPTFLAGQSNEAQIQYKVCICMPDGKIFLVPANSTNTPANCAKLSRSMVTDPCAQ